MGNIFRLCTITMICALCKDSKYTYLNGRTHKIFLPTTIAIVQKDTRHNAEQGKLPNLLFPLNKFLFKNKPYTLNHSLTSVIIRIVRYFKAVRLCILNNFTYEFVLKQL